MGGFCDAKVKEVKIRKETLEEAREGVTKEGISKEREKGVYKYTVRKIFGESDQV